MNRKPPVVKPPIIVPVPPRPGGRYRTKPSVPLWVWIGSPFCLFCFLVFGMITATTAPVQPVAGPKVEKVDSYEQAWESLPKKANGFTDWNQVDSVDVAKARSINTKAGLDIADWRLERHMNNAGEFN